MAPAKKSPAARTTGDDSVDSFMSRLDHPHKLEVEAIRRVILASDPAIAEGIKWNAPSFRTTEYFATINLRAKRGVDVIFHLGAKARDIPAGGLSIEDGTGMLKWLGKDRAMATFSDMKDVGARKAALEKIVRRWIVHV